MHTRSGLLAEIEASTLSLADAGAQTLAFLQSHIPEARKVPLAGNSIGTDRRFLAVELPEIEDFLQLPLRRRLHHQGALPALAPRRLQGGPPEAGRPPGAPGHPRVRGGAGLLPRGGLRPRRGKRKREGGHVSTTGKDTPSMSIAEANAALTAAGQLFEMEELDIRGVPTREWKNAPPSLRAVIDMSLGHGDKVFLVYEDERTTFAEHYRIACTLAHRLRTTFGIEQGDRVAIIMRNLPEWVMAFWGATLAGAIVVPLNAWWSGEELRYGLEDSGSKVAFVDTERVERIRPFLGGLPDLSAVIVADEHRTRARGPARRLRAVGGRPGARMAVRARPGRRGRGRLAARPDHRPGGRRHHLLHVGHHRPAQGRRRHPPEHGHQPDEPLLHQHPRRHPLRQPEPWRRPARRRRPPSCSRSRCSTPRAATPSWSPTWPPVASS